MKKQSFKCKQKQEAVCRLKELIDIYNLDVDDYYNFKHKNIVQIINQTDCKINSLVYESLNYLITTFEKKYNAMVYYMILAKAKTRDDSWITFDLFYVNKDKDTWKYNRKPEHDEVLVYSYNLTYPSLSEFGDIGIESCNGHLHRIY